MSWLHLSHFLPTSCLPAPQALAELDEQKQEAEGELDELARQAARDLGLELGKTLK